MRHVETPQAKHRTFVVEEYQRCIVPRCDIWTRTPTIHGMCPSKLWDIRHDIYYHTITGQERTGTYQQTNAIRGSHAEVGVRSGR